MYNCYLLTCMKVREILTENESSPASSLSASAAEDAPVTPLVTLKWPVTRSHWAQGLMQQFILNTCCWIELLSVQAFYNTYSDISSHEINAIVKTPQDYTCTYAEILFRSLYLFISIYLNGLSRP